MDTRCSTTPGPNHDLIGVPLTFISVVQRRVSESRHVDFNDMRSRSSHSTIMSMLLVFKADFVLHIILKYPLPHQKSKRWNHKDFQLSRHGGKTSCVRNNLQKHVEMFCSGVRLVASFNQSVRIQ